MIIPGYLVSAGLIGLEMLGWGSTFCVRESKLSRVAARFEYQHFSKSAPTRLQVCLAAWPRFSSLHALSCVMNEHDHRARCISFTETFNLFDDDPRQLEEDPIYSSGW